MIKIIIFASWTSCSNILKSVINCYDWKYDKEYGVKYIFTLEDDFTHAILMNIVIPDFSLEKNNIIGLAQEPAIFLNVNKTIQDIYKNSIKTYFIGSCKYINSPDKKPFKEGMSYLLPFIPFKQVNFFIKNYPEKNKLINYVYSNKNKNDNRLLYNYRHLLGNTILENDLSIDIYGNCTINLKEKFPKSKNIYFKFPQEDFHKIYQNYKFSIVIENTREEEYFSEKIIAPLLCGCVPIYIGCKNIDSYFKDYVIHLSGNLNDDMNLLKNILNNPDKYYKKINIEEIKEKVHLKNIIHQEFL